MEETGLPDPARLRDRFPHEFSGGMRQRALLALALAGDPELLLADEPTTALDVTLAAEILDLLEQLRRQRNLGVILVSHDLNLVASRCDRVVVMYAGVVAETASAAEIFAHPRHPYTRALLRATVDPFVGRLDASAGLAGDPLESLSGSEGCPFALRCPHAADVCRYGSLPLRPVAGDPAHRSSCLRQHEILT
jgi:oligopeptide/dipeptide ABC transporter ATP-binding protein